MPFSRRLTGRSEVWINTNGVPVWWGGLGLMLGGNFKCGEGLLNKGPMLVELGDTLALAVRLTDTTENITFLQTTYSGGNN